MKKRKIIIVISVILILGIAFYAAWTVFVKPNVNKSGEVLHIPPGASYEQMMDSIDRNNLLKNMKTFRLASEAMRFHTIRPGKYVFEGEESNQKIIQKLRVGQHYPVRFTFNNVRTKEQFVEKVNDKFLFANSDLEELLNDISFLNKYNVNPQNVISLFIPDSYEIYYDITAEVFFERMYHYYDKFWTDERKELAKSIGITPLDAITLASIVEEENYRAEEKPIIAGVYINRLHKGMKLQADPTVKYALGDFSLKRILFEHLEVDSPYNTYKYEGLPPGPIRIPEKSTVDAVLHYTRHNYIYMCAKEDFSGAHNFAATAQEHARNAAKYRKAVSKIRN